jgi:hypothetical protein
VGIDSEPDGLIRSRFCAVRSLASGYAHPADVVPGRQGVECLPSLLCRPALHHSFPNNSPVIAETVQSQRPSRRESPGPWSAVPCHANDTTSLRAWSHVMVVPAPPAAVQAKAKDWYYSDAARTIPTAVSEDKSSPSGLASRNGTLLTSTPPEKRKVGLTSADVGAVRHLRTHAMGSDH